MKKADRLKRRQERMNRLRLAESLTGLEKTHCKPCKKMKRGRNYSPEAVCGGCPIYSQIRAIGKEMINGEVIKSGRKSTKPYADIKLEEFKELKLKGLSDEDIAKKLGFSRRAIYSFKKRNGLIKKKITPKKKQKKNNDLGKGEVVMQTEIAKAVPLKDAFKVAGEHLKHLNKLEGHILPHSDGAVKKFRENLDLHASDINSLEIEKLKDQLLEGQSEIHRLSALNESLKTQNQKLRDYELDYRNLEADYLNSQSENKRLLEMLEKLKRTAEINVWLMEQHVGFMNQVEKNEEAREFVWR